uniref:At1g61320/AtMIF1 LRR domain-containing protein n=1 Tax=Hordeum vulgare subsp. vulgare TaxID=112509 RepID=A0A8I6YNR8_HORVV
MQQRAQEIDSFFSAYPSVLHCLTKLSLKNVDFEKLDMHHVLLDCCKQLKHLSLFRCDVGSFSLFKIDAPDSKLCVLEIDKCRFVRIDLVCLPKLEKFLCETWVPEYAPVTFGFVPSLWDLELSCGSNCDQREFRLSKLLYGVTSIHTLTLDFQGENLWLQPEMEELCTAFRNLRKLFLRGIFVEFDILWTTAFLVAAPSVEMLHIEVWEHVCDVGEARPASFLTRSTPRWERHLDSSSENKLLKELEFAGFKSLEHQFTFIRSMLQRCPNLQKIVLRGDEHCSSCDAHKASRPLKFPNRKEEQEMVVKRIRGGLFLPEIFFYE